MSRSRKSGKKGKGKQLGDVTLNDFANSSVCTNRPKKSCNSVTTICKKLSSEKTWDEKDDNDIDADFADVFQANCKIPDPKVKEKLDIIKLDEDYNYYPLDIWFLISEYIRPEDVSSFARICKFTSIVVQSPKFWYYLYKKYYKREFVLPDSLMPTSLMRLYGLRTYVIRSLFYMYEPFVNRFAIIQNDRHPDLLLKRQCILMWTKNVGSNWIYHFKLKRNFTNTFPHYRNIENKWNGNRLEMLDDIFANPDENCKLLKVTSDTFLHIPLVLGLTLVSAKLTLTGQNSHYRLKLNFSTEVKSYTNGSLGGSNDVSVILDPVFSWRVLDWWHPHYPHLNSINYLLNQD